MYTMDYEEVDKQTVNLVLFENSKELDRENSVDIDRLEEHRDELCQRNKLMFVPRE